MHMYDDIIPNDNRINILFNDGFEKIKVEHSLRLSEVVETALNG